ncbi:MAG: hypothetical protein ACOVQ4_12230 [Flectobacillus sp.]|uniref:hypothetical protein n=1 Tax=Flectobacillus sp. TaxID=50419 RepID=UPI003B9CFE65
MGDNIKPSSHEWAMALRKELIEDKMIVELREKQIEVMQKAFIVGIDNDRIIYDEVSMGLFEGLKEQIEVRQKQIVNYFNQNIY